EETRRRLREQMPVAERLAYFAHAAVSPVSGPASVAMNQCIKESLEEGDTRWMDWAGQLRGMREAAARLLGAEADELALVPNTTAGINLVAEGLDWRPGDNTG